MILLPILWGVCNCIWQKVKYWSNIEITLWVIIISLTRTGFFWTATVRLFVNCSHSHFSWNHSTEWSLDFGHARGRGRDQIEISSLCWISLGVFFQHTLLLLPALFLGLVTVPPSRYTLHVLAARLRRDLRDGLRVECWVLLLHDLPLRVFHYVRVVLAAIGEGGLLQVVAAVRVGEEKNLGHVHRVDDLPEVLLALHLQPWQLRRGRFTFNVKEFRFALLKTGQFRLKALNVSTCEKPYQSSFEITNAKSQTS